MKLYTNNSGEWVGTQADAKRLKDGYRNAEVPTDKPGLLEFLNKHAVGEQRALESEPNPDTETHGQSSSAYKPASDLNFYDVKDVVLNCDRAHLGSALGAIISRLHDEVDNV